MGRFRSQQVRGDATPQDAGVGELSTSGPVQELKQRERELTREARRWRRIELGWKWKALVALSCAACLLALLGGVATVWHFSGRDVPLIHQSLAFVGERANHAASSGKAASTTDTAGASGASATDCVDLWNSRATSRQRDELSTPAQIGQSVRSFVATYPGPPFRGVVTGVAGYARVRSGDCVVLAESRQGAWAFLDNRWVDISGTAIYFTLRGYVDGAARHSNSVITGDGALRSR
jgi:hypothetical protein